MTLAIICIFGTALFAGFAVGRWSRCPLDPPPLPSPFQDLKAYVPAQRVKRRYTCRRCGQNGHSSRGCPTASGR